MRLASDTAMTRLAKASHGVLCTVHPERGVDAVPVVFVCDDRALAVPIDTVKAKSTSRLQRVRNLEADHRATLLVEQWDPDDWSRLWWVRAEMRWQPSVGDEQENRCRDLLATRFSQYRDQPFTDVLVFSIVNVTGWAATA